jgi:hypothetical protein
MEDHGRSHWRRGETFRPLVAIYFLHLFHEDPDPHLSEKRDPDLH